MHVGTGDLEQVRYTKPAKENLPLAEKLGIPRREFAGVSYRNRVSVQGSNRAQPILAERRMAEGTKKRPADRRSAGRCSASGPLPFPIVSLSRLLIRRSGTAAVFKRQARWWENFALILRRRFDSILRRRFNRLLQRLWLRHRLRLNFRYRLLLLIAAIETRFVTRPFSDHAWLRR